VCLVQASPRERSGQGHTSPLQAHPQHSLVCWALPGKRHRIRRLTTPMRSCPSFSPCQKASQPALPCLVRQLLQQVGEGLNEAILLTIFTQHTELRMSRHMHAQPSGSQTAAGPNIWLSELNSAARQAQCTLRGVTVWQQSMEHASKPLGRTWQLPPILLLTSLFHAHRRAFEQWQAN